MASKFYALLTTRGEAKLAQAVALGTQLKITQMAVGDGGGAIPTPNASQTKLVNQQRIAAINTLNVDPVNTSQIIAEQVIPEDEGGWWIREVGLFDDAGELIAVANCAETYKPKLTEGSGRTQVIRMIVVVSSTEAVTIKIDPSVVLATRKYVDDKVIEVKAYTDSVMKAHLDAADPHPQYAPKVSPTFSGSPKAPTPANGNNTTLLATTEFVQNAIGLLKGNVPVALDTLVELAAAINNDPSFYNTMASQLALKAAIAGPTFTGVPKAPTAAAGNNSTQLATTQFVQSAIAALVASSPAALDTLKELADALGNDPNFATTMATQMGLKAPLESPALTGVPTAPTAGVNVNNNQLATTAFVLALFKSLLSSDTNSSSEALAATPKAVKAVNDVALKFMGNIASGVDFNTFGADKQGVWGVTTTAATANANIPEAALGFLEVIPYGSYGCTQRYTTRTGIQYVRGLSAAWNGNNGPWADWQMVGFQSQSGYFSGDLNALLSPGAYSVVSTATNIPVALVGTVAVAKRSSGEVLQTYRSVSVSAGNADREWKRTGNSTGTVWSTWTETATAEMVKGWGLGVSSTTAPNYIFYPSQSANTSPTQFINAKTSDDQATAHNPVSGEDFAGVNIQRDLRPVQIGVSGRGTAASLWIRGFSAAASVLGDWKQMATISDLSTKIAGLLLGTASKRDVGTGDSQIPDMSSFTTYGVASVFSAINIAGKKRMMEGNGSGNFSNGVFTFTLPLAFGGDGFTFLATDVGSGVFTMAAIPAGANKVTMYAKDGPGNAANGTIVFKYIAMGPV